jgi:IMP cyclohydrolase
MTIQDQAVRNFEHHLRQNPYPGRGLVVGRSADGAAYLQIYWIMGRSANSRNRKFVTEGRTLRTEPVDLSQVQDPSLIIYDAMLELPDVYIATNGDQTRTIVETMQRGGTFEEALTTREREPDAPNFTSRISGLVDLRGSTPGFALSILKANPFDPTLTDRFTYRPALPAAAFGVGLTTYQRDGQPLPAFSGEPLVLPCAGTAAEVLDVYWQALHPENRIALAVKVIPTQGGVSTILVRNRF